MELWFWAAVGSAVFAGLSNTYFKVAARQGYNAEVFSLYGVLLTVAIVSLSYVLLPSPMLGYGVAPFLVLFGGFIASFTGILKVFSLRYIDTTIYFPLFKLLAPLLAIIIGVTVFEESFSQIEWIGLALGLLIPLLLITKSENSRQQNLMMGLLLVLITGTFSAITAALSKFAIDLDVPIVVTYLYLAIGLLAGNICAIVYKSGVPNFLVMIRRETSRPMLIAGSMRALLISVSVFLTLYAFAEGGPLAIVQTVHSMYILIPIVFAIIFYGEHWNAQKVGAIVLSVAALGLLG